MLTWKCSSAGPPQLFDTGGAVDHFAQPVSQEAFLLDFADVGQELVAGDPEQPDAERLRVVQAGQADPCLEEGLLGEVFGGMRLPAQTGEPGADGLPVPIDQRGERRPVAGPRPAHAIPFLVTVHVASPSSAVRDAPAGSL